MVRAVVQGLRSAEGRVVLALVYTGLLLTFLEFFYMPPRIQARLDAGYRGGAISLEAGVTWALATSAGYMLPPLAFVLLLHRESPGSIGYRLRGFLRHAWIYLVLFAFMVPWILLAASRHDFFRIYPFVAEARRSWRAFLVWESCYVLQFFALEAFFRGYLLFTLERSMGWNAIFVMAVPYVMIHYHKPHLEAFGALVAGIVLGALALRLRSFLGGFLLHSLVAVSMDLLGAHRSGLF